MPESPGALPVSPAPRLGLVAGAGRFPWMVLEGAKQAGCHVIYGIRGYKTHSKTCLVVRRGRTGIRRYVHLGTGNYNDKTARLYTDFGVMTSDPDIGEFTDLLKWEGWPPDNTPKTLRYFLPVAGKSAPSWSIFLLFLRAWRHHPR